MRFTTDESAMARALELAARGTQVDPNPRVGCVITDAQGQVLAEGWHRGAGTQHAEADALAAAQEAGIDLSGATAFVTLEPCSHTGRTGPCSAALATAGVSRVVVAVADPNPVAAGGAEYLRAFGTAVEVGVLEDQATALNHDFLFAARHGRPFVTWKFAATLDGRSAAADGTSRWITSAPARERTHELRAQCGAIVAGTGTILTDDPHLTVRTGGMLAHQQPLRVVVGERDIPPASRVLDDAAPTLHLRTRDPHAVLDELHRRGIHRVWLEGGPTLAAAFWTAGVVDEVRAVVAPALLGAGRAAVGDLGITGMDDIARLELREVERVGSDVMLTLTPCTTPTGPTGRATSEGEE